LDTYCTRRAILAGLATTTLATLRVPAAAQPADISLFQSLIVRAERLAAAPYEPPAVIPSTLDYDDYRRINFRREQSLLDRSRFRLQLFHLGYVYTQAVDVTIVRPDGVRVVRYDPAFFDMGAEPLPLAGLDTGFAGLRLNFPLNDEAAMDEVISFLGASYFRFLGRGHRYGLSARGLAIGSGEPNEEFPRFREFWVVEPAPGARVITVLALMDSPSLAGAYRFIITPGSETEVLVEAVLHARVPVAALGVAPLTSMFFTGRADSRKRDPFRPQVHDSDGLLMRTGRGESIWRPLVNPTTVRLSWFADENPAGFGLMQSDSEFGQYQDLEARYDLRPSYWVQPVGNWGPGHVVLVELPTTTEFEDNIVAFWRPREPLLPGRRFDASYIIRARTGRPAPAELGQVVATFRSPQTGEGAEPGAMRFLVDFAGPALQPHLADPSQVSVWADVTEGRVVASIIKAHEPAAGLRLLLDVEGAPGALVNIRAALTREGRPLTETWAGSWLAPDLAAAARP
jgi:glucans biosynthesis protein